MYPNFAGQRFGQYEIREVIGRGGMAVVYRARQGTLNRDVAVKIMAVSASGQAGLVERFKREAALIATLEAHPNILPIYDYGQHEDYLYLVVRLMEGGSLDQRIQGKAVPLPDIDRLINQIASALDYAHNEGIVHRDLKPNNVLLDKFGNAYLMDFGIAKILSGTQITATNTLMGTPAYMAPEQWKLEKVDHRADIYSLGVILYEMVTGQVPFEAPTPHQLMYAHLHKETPRPSEIIQGLLPAIDQVIIKATAKNPEERYQTAGEMAAKLTDTIKQQETDVRGDLTPLTLRPVSIVRPELTTDREGEPPTQQPAQTPSGKESLPTYQMLESAAGQPPPVQSTGAGAQPLPTPASASGSRGRGLITIGAVAAVFILMAIVGAIIFSTMDSDNGDDGESSGNDNTAVAAEGTEATETPDASNGAGGSTDSGTPTAQPTETEVSPSPQQASASPTATTTPTMSVSVTSTVTNTATNTPSATATTTNTPTRTPDQTLEAEQTEEAAGVATERAGNTQTAEARVTDTPSASPTQTHSPTATVTRTSTPTATITLTATQLATRTPTATRTPNVTNTPFFVPSSIRPQTVLCPGKPSSTVKVGIRGRITFTDGSLTRLRAAPNGPIIERMPEGQEFDIVGGPFCGSSYTWWQLRLDDGRVGWTAEGEPGRYFLEPAPGNEVQNLRTLQIADTNTQPDVHTRAERSSAVIARLTTGDRVLWEGRLIANEGNSWAIVTTYNDASGYLLYAPSTAIEVDPQATTFGIAINSQIRILPDGDFTVLRGEPEITAVSSRTLRANTTLTVTDGPVFEDYFMWWEVRLEDGTSGWIRDIPGWYEVLP